MISNLLYLIDTGSIDLLVRMFTMTIDRNNQLVLTFVRELGRLKDLKKFNTNNVFVGVKEIEFQDKKSDFVKSFFPDDDFNYVVSAIIKEKKRLEILPFGIRLFKNNLTLITKPNNPVTNNDYVVVAALNYAKTNSENGILTIMQGNKNNCNFYELKENRDSKYFDITKIPREKNIALYNLPRAQRRRIHGRFGTKYVNYESFRFDENWRTKALVTMRDFFIEETESLIPQYDGTWSKCYIEGMSFPFMRFFNKIPDKTQWEEFLKDKKNFPVDINKLTNKKAS